MEKPKIPELLVKIFNFLKTLNEDIVFVRQEVQNLKANSKNILNADEAANYLGVKKSYLYKKTSAKEITYYSGGGKLIYFKKEDLEKYLLRNPQFSYQDMEYDIQRKWKK